MQILLNNVDKEAYTTPICGLMHFGKTIRRLRRDRELEQEDLARAADLSRSMIQNLEKCEARPKSLRPGNFRKLVGGLGMTVEAFKAEILSDHVAVHIPKDVYELAESAAEKANISPEQHIVKVLGDGVIQVLSDAQAGAGAKRSPARPLQPHQSPAKSGRTSRRE